MKNLLISLLAFTALNAPAFAIDQVILKNGDIVEGKVLSDVPNRHVDIQLVNGNKKRFQQTEVSSVERDVPSNKDQDTFGSDSRMYFGVMGGLFLNTDSSNDATAFAYGARFGANVAQMGDFAKLGVGLSFTRLSKTASSAGISASVAFNEIMAQFLFRKVGNSGFFFGPELGIVITSASIASTGLSGSGSSTDFQMGLNLGYDYFITPNFSMGPSIYYDHNFITGGLNNMKFLLAFTIQ